MAALKKWGLLPALLVLAGIGTTTQAQVLQPLTTCSATAVPPVVRAEGIAELVGDIVLVCTANIVDPDIPAPVVTTNVSVSLNVNVTNNINFGAGSGITDAVLVINENNCVAPASVGSTFGNCATPDNRFQDPQFGGLAAPNRLEWNEVAFPVPGASDGMAGTFPSVTTLRITSMRGNAAQLGVPEAATFPSTQITAFVSITGPTTIPITNNVLNVAVPILGLLAQVGDPIAGLQCLDFGDFTSLTLAEGFATSFKTIGVPTFQPGATQWESGYYAPGSNNGGGASQGTRFIFEFLNIPEGVSIAVPGTVATTNPNTMLPCTADPTEQGECLHLTYIANAGTSGAGGSFSPGGTQEVTLSGGFGFAVYEVTNANSFAVESVNVPVSVEWDADTPNDLPAIGVGQVRVSFAPLSTVLTANAGAPEPRFVRSPGDPRTLVGLARCTSTILFPFVTNQAGFDTGFAISNTSLDWLGTDPQTGVCTLHYHGETAGGGAAPPDQTSTPLAGGEQLLFTLSGGNAAANIAGAPEFQGYVIAVCEFQYAHGFAFITDGFGGIPALAQGYLGLIIPWDGPGTRFAGSGESLGH